FLLTSLEPHSGHCTAFTLISYFYYAMPILDQVFLTERGLRELNNLQQGELKLGASLTIGNYWLPDCISQFKLQHPGISVICTLANAEEICEGTATGLFDLGIVSGEVRPSLKTALAAAEVGRDRLQIVVGKSHPWFKHATVTVEELMQTAWVMRESDFKPKLRSLLKK
ncbi:LysR substrate-binding domain-containing protein, partial [Leptolyngbyaceae cyanobacterium UHCC 1019]